MTDSVARSPSRRPLHAVSPIGLSIEKSIFRNPREVIQASVELLRLLSDRFSNFISRPHFEMLLGRAAHRARIDLSRFHDACGQGRTRPKREELRQNRTEQEMEQIGCEAILLLTTLMGLLVLLIGERKALRQFNSALMPVGDTMPGTDRPG